MFSAWECDVCHQGEQGCQDHWLWSDPETGGGQECQGPVWYCGVLCPWNHQFWASLLYYRHVVLGSCDLCVVSSSHHWIQISCIGCDFLNEDTK